MTRVIRREQPSDVAAIYRVNASAFESDAEARLVDALRVNHGLVLSLVAEVNGEVVGHIAFSAVTVTREDGTSATGIGLAPMAVLPAHQRSGIGAALMEAGLRWLTAEGHPFCVVLGHAGYYPRFGFRGAREVGLRWEHEVSEGSFFARSLAPRGLEGVTGVVRYRAELGGL